MFKSVETASTPSPIEVRAAWRKRIPMMPVTQCEECVLATSLASAAEMAAFEADADAAETAMAAALAVWSPSPFVLP